MADEETCLQTMKDWYINAGSRFRRLRLPIDWEVEGAYNIVKEKSTIKLHSIAQDMKIDAAGFLTGNFKKATFTFEENWGKMVVMICSTGQRIECARLFPEVKPQLALGDAADDDDEDERMHTPHKPTTGGLPSSASRPAILALAAPPGDVHGSPPAKRRRSQASASLALADGSPDDTSSDHVNEATRVPPPPPPEIVARESPAASSRPQVPSQVGFQADSSDLLADSGGEDCLDAADADDE